MGTRGIEDGGGKKNWSFVGSRRTVVCELDRPKFRERGKCCWGCDLCQVSDKKTLAWSFITEGKEGRGGNERLGSEESGREGRIN